MSDLITLAEEAEAPPPKLTSHDLKIGLRSSLGAGYQVFFEVGNDTGVKVTRHADAVAIGIWPSTGHQIHGHEIKVSRGDFLSEMKQPEKSWPVMQYCHRWSLLTPPGLIKADELPPNWGWKTYDGRVLRTVKQAPLLTPVPLSGGFVAALVRRAGEADSEIISAAVSKAISEAKLTVSKVVERERERWERNRGLEAEDAAGKLAKYEALFGKLSSWEIDRLAPILNALRVNGVDRVLGDLSYQQKQIERANNAISKALETMQFPTT